MTSHTEFRQNTKSDRIEDTIRTLDLIILILIDYMITFNGMSMRIDLFYMVMERRYFIGWNFSVSCQQPTFKDLNFGLWQD